MNDKDKKTILLVEDEAILALTEKMVLEKYGYNVITADSGEKAIEHFKNNKDIDLILMDIDLGNGLDGTETAGIILKDQDIPVVFLSSHTEPAVVEKTEKITSYGYVVKSSSITVLDASIKMALKLFNANRRVENELAERKRAEEKIQEMDLQRRKLFANVPELIYQFTRRPDGSYYVPIASEGIINIFGCSPEDVCDNFEPISRVIYPEDAVRVIEAIEYSAKHLTYFTCEFRVHIPGKDIQWIISRSMPERLPDGSITWYGFNADITYRKMAEVSIREQRDFSESLIETAQTIILVLDTQGRIVRFNPYMEKLSGYALDEVKGMDWFETFIQPENGHTVKSVFQKAVTGTQTTGNINPIIAKDGRSIIVEWHDKTLTDKDGLTVGVLAVGYDITEREQVVEKLRRSEYNLRNSQRIANVGSWCLNVATNHVVWTEELYNMYGFDPSVPPPPYTEHMKLFTPESWERLSTALANTSEVGIPYTLELETIRKDGTNGWMWVQGEADVDSVGKIVGLWGAAQDITERKCLENELNEAKNYLENLLNYANAPIIVWDTNYKITKFNRAFERISGRLSVDVIGKHIDILFPVETREQSLVHIQEATVGKRWEVVEIGIGHVNGAVYTLLWNSAAIYMSDGKTIRSIIAQGHDITIRTQLAIELKKSEEKYKSLFMNVSDAIFVYDPDTFIITEVNDATSRLYGYEKEELIGMSCLKFSAEVDKSKQVADKIISEGRADVNFRHHKKKDGTDLYVYLSGHKVTVNGKVMTFSVCRDVTERKSYEDNIKNLLQEKELILKEVHHRLKNNMNTVKGLLFLQIAFLKDPLAISALQGTISRIDSMVVLYDKLYCSHNFNDISVLTYLPSLIDEIIANFPGSESVKVEKKIDDFIVEVKKLQPLGIIINELLTNIMKYAFTGRENNLITVSATLTDKRVSIIVSDNGNGIPESVTFENSTGFGMQLVSMLTVQIGGNITIERERERERIKVHSGIRFALNFPSPTKDSDNCPGALFQFSGKKSPARYFSTSTQTYSISA